MKIVLDQSNSKKRKRADKRLTRFEKLRDRLKRKQKQLERFESEIDDLVNLYHKRVFPVESEELEPLSRLAEKLIGFLGRKSLSARHRDELADWIIDTLSAIRTFDTQVADRLMESYLGTVAAYLGMSVEEMKREYQEEERLFREGMEDELDPDDNPFSDQASPQDDMFGFNDLDMDNDDPDSDEDEGSFQDDPFQYATEQPAVSDEQLMSGSWIRGLFRRTAHALHPDREQDPGKQAEKHELMTRLLEARKQEDVMTILELYTEHVSGEALSIADEDMDAICQMLENRIEDLDERQYDYLWEDPNRQMVYDLLYGKSKTAREGKLKAVEKEIRSQIHATDKLAGDLRNLTILREHLKSRRHAQSAFDDIDQIFDILNSQTRPPFDAPF